MNRYLSRLKTSTGITATVAALVVGTIFFKLGMWQLSRADEKTSIVRLHEAAMELPPLAGPNEIYEGDSDDGSNLLYRRVKLTGRYDPDHHFLLDNRTVAGQAGFEVITPFMLADNKYILVNRGWIGHNGDRQVTLSLESADALPEVLQGIVVKPSKGIVLGDSAADLKITEWPVIIQFIDYETIAAKLDKIPVIDAVVIAAQGQPGNYLYNWKPVASGARIHFGYAFQWFAMLFALAILYLYLMVFRPKDMKNE